MSSMITIERLRQVLRYEPESGKLFWKERPAAQGWNPELAGTEALTAENRGYRRGIVDGVCLRAHRVAFALHHGVWPANQIDHINGVRSDNRIENLRDVDRSTNLKNAKLRSDNTTGFVGVSPHAATGKWCAVVSTPEGRKHLGVFPSIELAVEARDAAANELGYHPNHGRSA